MAGLPRFTLDQLASLVELARNGSLREAAKSLHLTEVGLRSRLKTLEARLGVQCYVKNQGRRGQVLLTAAGQALVREGEGLLAQARRVDETAFDSTDAVVHVTASQYLAHYVLVDTIRQFQSKHPRLRVRLSTRIENEIEHALLRERQLDIAFCAPHGLHRELKYIPWFTMSWSFVCPPTHPLASCARVSLKQIAREPLIVFEPGSTGREHQLEAFLERGLSPRIEMEASTTSLVLKMVEAGLGVSIVPLLGSGVVTRNVRVHSAPLSTRMRPIHSGILTRLDSIARPPVQALLDFALARRP